MQVWRICKQRYSAAAFTGEGARLFAGRWNPPGVRMVYCSNSLALASLEFFVHLDPSVAPDDLVSTRAEFPEDRALDQAPIERIEPGNLPTNWRETENSVLQRIGADWVTSLRSVVLIVPSAVVDGEWNVLLNPAHPDFALVKVEEPKPFHFDARMFSR
jgi:RES domain-containing protein